MIMSSGTLLAAIGFGARDAHRRRAVLPARLDAGGERAVPAGRAGRARARDRDGAAGARRRARSPAAVPRCRRERRSATSTTRRSADRPGDPGCDWRSSAWLHRVRAAGRGTAAAVGLPRQVRDAVGAARSAGIGAGAARSAMPAAHWALFALLIVSGLLATIALSRAGIRHFWAPQDAGAAPARHRMRADRGCCWRCPRCWRSVREPVLRLRAGRRGGAHRPDALHRGGDVGDAAARTAQRTTAPRARRRRRRDEAHRCPRRCCRSRSCALWLALERVAGAGNLLLAAVVALAGCRCYRAAATAAGAHAPPAACCCGWSLAVGHDVVQSNCARRLAMLTRRAARRARRSSSSRSSCATPTALAALAVITTVVPGHRLVGARARPQRAAAARVRPRRRGRLHRPLQGALRAAAAGDLRMSPLLSAAIVVTLGCYALAMALALLRLLRGPTAQDRVLALDFLYVNGMLVDAGARHPLRERHVLRGGAADRAVRLRRARRRWRSSCCAAR